MRSFVLDGPFSLNGYAEVPENNIVLISSYDISDDRFEEVYSFDKARSTLQGGCHNSKREKLFMVK